MTGRGADNETYYRASDLLPVFYLKFHLPKSYAVFVFVWVGMLRNVLNFPHCQGHFLSGENMFVKPKHKWMWICCKTLQEFASKVIFAVLVEKHAWNSYTVTWHMSILSSI